MPQHLAHTSGTKGNTMILKARRGRTPLLGCFCLPVSVSARPEIPAWIADSSERSIHPLLARRS